MWDLILVHVSPGIHDTITKLRDTFDNNAKKFDAVVTQICGLDDVDEFGSSLDFDLGDLVITLQQLATSYTGTVKQHNELVEFACDLLQHPGMDVRLRCLLGSVFSNSLYDVICALSHPLHTHHTLVRAAAVFPGFRTVSIHMGSPPTLARKAISSPLKTSTPPQQSQSVQFHRVASSPRTPTPPQRHLTPPQGSMMDTIWSYLPEEDRGVNLFRLQPASKQVAALLIGCLQHGVPVPPGSDTYYLFGFTTCRNKKEEGDLADYYRQLLKTNIERTIVFTSINKALEHSTLAGLLRNKAGPNLDKYFPALQQFLAAQPEKRFSAHRLVQFIRDEDNDEPLPCLKRDYGFGLCTQREHVTKLKALYGKVIDKAGPGKLHYACTFGRLLEHAVPSHRRHVTLSSTHASFFASTRLRLAMLACLLGASETATTSGLASSREEGGDAT